MSPLGRPIRGSAHSGVCGTMGDAWPMASAAGGARVAAELGPGTEPRGATGADGGPAKLGNGGIDGTAADGKDGP